MSELPEHLASAGFWGIGQHPCLTPAHHHHIVSEQQDDGSYKLTCAHCGRSMTVGARAGGHE
jgi:hypothetical protein